MPAWLGSGFNAFWIANVCFLVEFLHIGEQRGKASSSASLIRALTPFTGAPPSRSHQIQITSQRPYLLIASHWRKGFHIWFELGGNTNTPPCCSMYLHQIIMLYTFNVYNVICRLYLNNTRRNQNSPANLPRIYATSGGKTMKTFRKQVTWKGVCREINQLKGGWNR